MKGQFTTERLRAINHRHIRRVDKFYRMYAGLSSQLVRFEDDIMYVEIMNTERHILSTFNTAVAFASRWREWNEELAPARGFVVVFKKAKKPTGFSIPVSEDTKSLASKVNDAFRQLKGLNRDAHVSHIFSSVFTYGMNQVQQDLRKRKHELP